MGQVENLQPIANRLHTLLRIFPSKTHILFVSSGTEVDSTLFRSRRLPHYHCVGQATFLTWRLHGSLPPNRSFSASIPSGKAFLTMDRLLDGRCTGPIFLRDPAVAKMVMDAIFHRDLRAFQLHAFVVMPNHVHLLVTPLEAVSKIMQSLKRFTARQGNLMLGRTGQPFWQDETYDRLVRNETEFERITHYIEWNPVSAGLAEAPEDFPWSSARPIANRPQVSNLPHI